jgi:hypothetical protein
VAPGNPWALDDSRNNLVAIFSPAYEDLNGDYPQVTITATVGDVSKSIQVDLKPTLNMQASYVELPQVWSYGGTTGIGIYNKGYPVASTADKAGNLYLSYTAPVSEIKKVATDGTITTFAHVDNPGLLAFGPNGILYVVDAVRDVMTTAGTVAIRMIAPNGSVSTLTQTAPFDRAKGTVDGPSGVATASGLGIVVSPTGVVYVNDYTSIRKIAPDGSFSTFVGGGYCDFYGDVAPPCPDVPVNGHGTDARFVGLGRMVVDSAGNLYVGDTTSIRKITPAGDVSILAGSSGSVSANRYGEARDGAGSAARFNQISRMTIDPAGNMYLFDGNWLRKVTPSGTVSTVAFDFGGIPNAMRPELDIQSIYAGIPGVLFRQTSESIRKWSVD